METVISQKDTAFVDLAEEVVALYRSGYRVDAAVAVLLCLSYVKSPKAKERIHKAILDMARRDLQPAEVRPYPWEDTKGGDAHDLHDP